MLNSRVTEEVVNAVHKCTTVRLAVWQMLTELRDINVLCLTLFSYCIKTYSSLCRKMSACVTCVQCYCCLYLCSVSKCISGCFTSRGKFSRNVFEVSGENCL